MEKKVQIAFSIGRMPQDIAIQIWPTCPGPFSHVQMIKGNEIDGYEIVDSYPNIGVTIHQDFHGHFYGIVICDILATEERLLTMFDDIKTQEGKKYDWRGIAGVVTHKNIQDHEDWFCSEIDSFYLDKHGILPLDPDLPAHLVIPNKLYQQGITKGVFKVAQFIPGHMKL